MKQNSKCKRIATIFLVILVLSVAFIGNLNNVYAEVNTLYGDEEFTSTQVDVNKAVSDSVVLQAIGYLVYAVAGFIEKIVTWMMKIFTGLEIFPWADKVIFNTISFLDVNFLNPSAGSMFENSAGEPTIFGTVIQNIYYTIFVLTVAFFGVVVGIMALRLAISSIASEKAKYKEAITNWLLALILIFTAHYLMSFVFWVNEKMVEVATSVVLGTIEKTDAEIDMNVQAMDQNVAIALTHNLINASLGTKIVDNGTSEIDIGMFYNNSKFLVIEFYGVTDAAAQWVDFDIDLVASSIDGITNPNGTFENGSSRILEMLGMTKSQLKSMFSYNMGLLLSDEEYMAPYKKRIPNYDKIYDDITEDALSWDKSLGENVENFFKELYNNGKLISSYISDFDADSVNAVSEIIEDALILTLMDNKIIENLNSYDKVNKIQHNTAEHYQKFKYYTPDTNFAVGDDEWNSGNIAGVYNAMCADSKYNINSNFINMKANGSVNATEEIFAGLGQYFKNLVYGAATDENGNVSGYDANSEFNYIAAIMYAMFVFQSLMYFIAYIRRFFYVIVLALFAPLIIVFDFLVKSTK